VAAAKATLYFNKTRVQEFTIYTVDIGAVMPDIKTTFQVEKISRTKSRIADANGDYPDQWEVEGKYPWDNRFPSKFWLPGHNEAPEVGTLKVVVFKSDSPKKEEYDGNQPWMFSYKFQRILDADEEASTEGEKDDIDPPEYRNSAFSNRQLDKYPNRYEWQGARGARHGMLFNQACEMARVDAANDGDRQPRLDDIGDWYRSLADTDNELWQEIGQHPEQMSNQPSAASSQPDAPSDATEQSSEPEGTEGPLFPEGRVFVDIGGFMNAAYSELKLYSKDVWRLLDMHPDEIDQKIKDGDRQLWSTLDYKSKNPSD